MRILFSLLVLVVATSCTSIYFPNSQNIPTFKGAKEFQGNAQAQVFMPPFAYSFQAQGAYSITNHVGIIANYAYVRTFSKGEGQLGELGLGYFKTINNNHLLSVFLGCGKSSSKDDTQNLWLYLLGTPDPNAPARYRASQIKSDYISWFVQPIYGMLVSDNLHVVVSMKTSLINFENTYYGTNFIEYENKGPSFHIEPNTTLKYNFDNSSFSLIGQAGAHFTNNPDIQLFTNIARFALGFQWRISPNRKKE